MSCVEMRETRKEAMEYFSEEIEDDCLMVVILSGEVVYARTLKNGLIEIYTQGTHVCQNKNYLTTYPVFFLKRVDYGTKPKKLVCLYTCFLYFLQERNCSLDSKLHY